MERRLVGFELEDGVVLDDWNAIGDRKIKSIQVDIVSLGVMPRAPKLVLAGYDRYMYQKFMEVAVSMSLGAARTVPFSGVEVGGYNADAGVWVVFELDIPKRCMQIVVKKDLTTNAIKDGVK